MKTVRSAHTRKPISAFPAMTSVRLALTIVEAYACPASAAIVISRSFTAILASINASMATTVIDKMQIAKSVKRLAKHAVKIKQHA